MYCASEPWHLGKHGLEHRSSLYSGFENSVEAQSHICSDEISCISDIAATPKYNPKSGGCLIMLTVKLIFN